MRVVKVLRSVAVMLMTGLVAGPALLDRCLISCHDDSASESAVPTCHEHAQASMASSIHGVEACGHDHDGLPADTITDTRAAKTRHGLPFAAVPAVRHLDPPRSIDFALEQVSEDRTSSGRPVRIPLRL
jgi:hypothetical protein